MDTARLFSVRGLPLLGNPRTGHLIGLEPHEVELARAVAVGELSVDQAKARNPELGEQLEAGAYTRPSEPSVRGAYLHVTHRCNLRCEGCYSQEEHRNARPDPSFDQLARALRFLAQVGVQEVNISGGEPFLRADLPAIVRLAAEECAMPYVNVLTNGTRGTDEMLAACAPWVSMLSVSFDGASAQDAAHIRGEQRFDELVAFVARAQRAGLAVCITPTLHRLNLLDVPRYLQLADRLGCAVGFSLLSPTSGGAWGELLLDEDDAREVARQLLSQAQAAQGEQAALSLALGLSCRENCGAGITTLSVAADGAVYPCHMMHEDRWCMGNVFDGTVRLEEGHRPWTAGGGACGCDGCDLALLCAGGCRARALAAAQDRDPYCALFEEYLGAVVDRIKESDVKEEWYGVSQ